MMNVENTIKRHLQSQDEFLRLSYEEFLECYRIYPEKDFEVFSSKNPFTTIRISQEITVVIYKENSRLEFCGYDRGPGRDQWLIKQGLRKTPTGKWKEPKGRV